MGQRYPSSRDGRLKARRSLVRDHERLAFGGVPQGAVGAVAVARHDRDGHDQSDHGDQCDDEQRRLPER